MAHVTCLAAARHALLKKRGWNVEEQGLAGASPIRIISGEHRHGSFERAARLVGLGFIDVIILKADSDSRLSPRGTPRHAFATGDRPPSSLQAGEINTGGYDPFPDLIPIARRHDAWVHVDGAFGLWAAASPRYRHRSRHGSGDSGPQTVINGSTAPCAFTIRCVHITHPEHSPRLNVPSPRPISHERLNVRDQMDWVYLNGPAAPVKFLPSPRWVGRNGVAHPGRPLLRSARAIVDRTTGPPARKSYVVRRSIRDWCVSSILMGITIAAPTK